MEEINRVGLRNKSVKINAERIDVNCRSNCPVCGYGPLDCATELQISEPGDNTDAQIVAKAGDVTICSGCGEVLMFFQGEKHLELKPADESTWDDIKTDPDFHALVIRASLVYRNRNERKK